MTVYRGHSYDGQSAVREDAVVRTMPTGLMITDPGGMVIATWDYRDLRLLEDVYPGQPVRLTSRRDRERRVIVADTGILDALRGRAPRLRFGDRRNPRTAPRALGWGAASLATLAGLYFVLPLMAGTLAVMVPVSWEEAWGKSVTRQALTLFGGGKAPRTCDDPQGVAALARLTRRITAATKTRYTFRVRVVDSPKVNAFAAPGGYVIIFRGLLAAARSPDEVAGVLAHEAGHVVRRHSTAALIRAMGLSTVARTMFGDASSVAGDIATAASVLVTLSYSRTAEREADRAGVAMLNRAGIRGAGLADFFARVAGAGRARPGATGAGKGKGAGIGRYLSTHPKSARRAKAVRAASTGTKPALSAADWQALKAICRKKPG